MARWVDSWARAWDASMDRVPVRGHDMREGHTTKKGEVITPVVWAYVGSFDVSGRAPVHVYPSVFSGLADLSGLVLERSVYGPGGDRT